MQAASYLADATMVESELRTLAEMGYRPSLRSSPHIWPFSYALLRLQPQHLQAVCRHMLTLAPLQALLANLPFVLHQPLLQGLLTRDPCPALSARGAVHMLQLDMPDVADAKAQRIMPAVFSKTALSQLCPQLANLPSLTHFSLRGWYMKDHDVAAVVAALQAQTQLTGLHLDGNICGDCTAHTLSVALAHWPLMQDLRMPNCKPDGTHRVSQAGAEVLASSLRMLSRVNSLQLSSSVAAAASCGDSLAGMRSLRQLFGEGTSGVCAALKCLSRLSRLQLRKVSCSFMEDAEQLCEALSSMPGLKWLSVEHFTHADLAAIPGAQLLQLEHLHLPGFSDDSALSNVDVDEFEIPEGEPVPIAPGTARGLQSIANCSRLTYLRLGHTDNAPHIVFVSYLSRVLASLPGLQELHWLATELWFETNFDNMFAAVQQASALTSLSWSIYDTNSGDFVPAELVPAQVRRLALAVWPDVEFADLYAASIFRMTQLTALEMSSKSKLDDDLSSVLLPGIAVLQTLRTLVLRRLHLAGSAREVHTLGAKMSALQALHFEGCWMPEPLLWANMLLGGVHTLRVCDCESVVDGPRSPIACSRVLAAVHSSDVRVLESNCDVGCTLEDEYPLDEYLCAVKRSSVKVFRWSGWFTDPAHDEIDVFNTKHAGSKWVGALCDNSCLCCEERRA